MHSLNTDESFDLVIHKVGNSFADEGVILSKTLTFYSAELAETLYDFFQRPFKTDEYFHFSDDKDLNQNEIYSAVKNIFEDSTQLLVNSESIAQKLYSCSGNSKTIGGELFVVYFPDALIDGENTAAIGIFKSETKERFLKAFPKENNFDLSIDSGILLSKIDKAALIFNVENENGFVVCSVDKGRGEDFGVWADEFLNIRQREDDFFDTENTLNLCKSFVMDQLPEEFDINRIDQADLLNKSVEFFKESDTFEVGEFADKVLTQTEIKQSFEDYKNKFQEVYEIELNDHFDISKNAVKKHARFFKSIIKLDKNFHIYVHGSRNRIEQGVDEKGNKYYKLFYDAES